jgi:hypothetical protein
MPSAGLEPAILEIKRPKIYALDPPPLETAWKYIK